MQQLVILTGMSGAGKTVALRALEDMEFYCVDNLPVAMLGDFVEHMERNEAFYPKVSVGIDIRSQNQNIPELCEQIEGLETRSINHKVIFLNADKKILVQRFSETRRKHPLSSQQKKYSLSQAIDEEFELMDSVKRVADLVLDTGNHTAAQLKQQIWQLMSLPSDKVSIIVKSFAFKRGVPFDADFVFDARCLPNPYWQAELRPFNGRDSQIIEFFAEKEVVIEYLRDLCRFCRHWIPRFEANDRSYITIAIGCTGGQHRSVYLAEQLYADLTDRAVSALLLHRELGWLRVLNRKYNVRDGG